MANTRPSYLLRDSRLFPLRRTVSSGITTSDTHHPSLQCRFASTSPSKPRVLEKPTRFNPPSHGRRLRERLPRIYGPELTTKQKEEQGTKHYPNMMPPEGTFMHWFLTNRGIHLWIILGTLSLLASFAAWENWCRSNIFYNGLPTKGNVLRHPIDSFWQFFFACQRSMVEGSRGSVEKNQRNVDDMCKRASYRKAHGEEKEQQIEFWPEFERRYGKMVIDEKTGRLVDENTLPNKGEKQRPKLWLGIF